MKPRTRTREERIFPLTDVEVRSVDGEPTKIVGHAALYNVWSQDLGGFRERLLPGVFTKTLGEADIRALFNHDENFILGRNKSGTLALTDQARGLKFEADPPDTQTIRDLVLTPMARGDLDQCSFAFQTVRDEWREPKATGGLYERDLIEAKLFDVSVVTFPAYTQTDASLRSLVDFGLDVPALSALLIRADRGLLLSSSDIDLVNGSIEVLRSYLPAAPVVDDDHPTAPDAARTVAHLRRLLEHTEAVA